MREVHFELDYVKYPAGSCLACFGDTKVICTATIDDSVPPFLEGKGSGWVTAEYGMLPGSTWGGRKRRDGVKRDGRGVEISRLIGRSLRAAVKLDRLGERSILIDCDVLQADGGTRTAAISGGWVALYRALQKLHAESGGPAPDEVLAGQLSAVSVGIVGGEIVCDLDYYHDSRAEVDLNVVMRDQNLVEIQGTGEKGVFDRTKLNQLMDAAEEGIALIRTAQRKALQLVD
jgi:ribonuclease PH